MVRFASRLILLRRIAWLAMLLPFLALSSVPSGMMPGTTGDGTLTLVLCTADGPREMTVDLGNSNPPEAQKQGCPWALAQLALVLPQEAMLPLPVIMLPREAFRTQLSNLLPATIPGPRTARAPPTLA